MARSILLDKNWARHAFLLSERALSDDADMKRRVYTTSSRKFTDTTMGGSFALNPLPQFTDFADIAHKSLYSASAGLGRWYSEVIEDNAQLVHFRMGVPKYNSLTTFLGNFYSVEASSVARTGRGPDVWFRIGQVAGTIAAIPLMPFVLAGGIIRMLLGRTASRYYYLKPTMFPYWTAVGSIMNGIIVNLGVIPRAMSGPQASLFNENANTGSDDIAAMNRIFPDIYRGDGGIDVFAIANRAQRLADAYNSMVESAMDSVGNNPATRQSDVAALMTNAIEPGIRNLTAPWASLEEYRDVYLAVQGNYDEAKALAQTSEIDERSSSEPGAFRKFIDSMQSNLLAEARMGADFMTLRVDFTSSNNESFSNTATESGIQSTMNQMSSSARQARFNLADGNLTEGMGAVVGALASTAKGVLDGFQVSGLIAVAGNAFVDIPKVYDTSSADFNRTSFTIPLRAWCANEWCRIQNLFLPMAAIMAMCLPRSVGRQAWDSPFILEMYNQGHTQIPLGLVESFSVQRGVGDVGWARGGKFLGMDITLSIIDLSSILHMPINPALSETTAALAAGANAIAGADITSGLLRSTYDEDNAYTNYLAVLGSLPLEAQINTMRAWRLRMARTRAEINQMTSHARAASMLMSGVTGDVIKAFSLATDRQ